MLRVKAWVELFTALVEEDGVGALVRLVGGLGLKRAVGVALRAGDKLLFGVAVGKGLNVLKMLALGKLGDTEPEPVRLALTVLADDTLDEPEAVACSAKEAV